MDRATRVALLQAAPFPSTKYWWRSPNQLLLDGPNKARSAFMQEMVQLDCSTGITTPLGAMNKREQSIYWWRTRNSISPDGKWALLEYGGDFRALNLDTAEGNTEFPNMEPFTASPASNALWLRDNLRWVFLRYNHRKPSLYAIEQSVDRRQTMRFPDFRCPRGSTMPWEGAGSRLLGFIGKDRLLGLPNYSCFYSKRQGCLWMYELTVGHNPDVKEYPIALPSGAHALDTVLSANGKRLALVLRRYGRPPVSPLHQVLGRWWPQILPKPRSTMALFTLDRDGKHWQTLGYLPQEETDYDDRMHECLNLQWNPDGHRLSFVRKGALWTVPAD
jgi:hypothetical protein